MTRTADVETVLPVAEDGVPLEDLVTVVIPARNEEESIRVCLDSVLRQDHRNLQVIVIDGASQDRTAAIVRQVSREDPRVELLHNPHAIISRSLNMALDRARGAWLVRVDAHSTIPSDYVARVLGHLRTGRWGGVGGRKDGVGRTPTGRAVAAAMGSRFGQGNSVYHYGTVLRTVEHIPFGAYPTSLARQLGGWDERLPVNQDYEFDYRVRKRGRPLLFDPAVRIDWECRQTIGDLFRQSRRYGRDKARSIRIHPDSTGARHLVAAGLVPALAGAAVAGFRWPRLAVAIAAPYVAALSAASILTGRRVARSARPFVPAAFLALHVGWGIGFWEGAVAEGRAALAAPWRR